MKVPRKTQRPVGEALAETVLPEFTRSGARDALGGGHWLMPQHIAAWLESRND